MFLALLLAPSHASAQGTAATPPAASTAPTPTVPPKAQEEEVLKMDPFEVVTAKDTSYGALNSNSITRFNT
ncbi:MAG TPA: hypothetical protein VFB27_08245, partial [Opitutaceae bacterium]|nr:hypothetical protein [Opitutaceae bacterium]